MNGATDLRRAYRETVILCGAMVASVCLYAVVVEVVGAQLPPRGAATGLDLPLLRYAFYLLAGVGGLAIPLVRRLVESAVRAPGTVVARLRTGAVVAAAVAEMPAVLGLVLFFVAGSRRDFYALAGWSVLLQIFHFPRHERWVEAAQAAARQPRSGGAG